MLSLWKDWSHEIRLSKLETRKRQRQSIRFRGQEDSDGGDKTLDDIFYTKFDPIFLKTKDGYAMSDWILDFGVPLHLSPHK